MKRRGRGLIIRPHLAEAKNEVVNTLYTCLTCRASLGDCYSYFLGLLILRPSKINPSILLYSLFAFDELNVSTIDVASRSLDSNPVVPLFCHGNCFTHGNFDQLLKAVVAATTALLSRLHNNYYSLKQINAR